MGARESDEAGALAHDVLADGETNLAPPVATATFRVAARSALRRWRGWLSTPERHDGAIPEAAPPWAARVILARCSAATHGKAHGACPVAVSSATRVAIHKRMNGVRVTAETG